jgi:hypothetical protein
VDVEFGDKLELIGECAFNTTHLRGHIQLPKVRAIGKHAFCNCSELMGVDFSEDLESIGYGTFDNSP